MSHRLGAVSSDYCSVCQNGLLPSAAATAGNPLWPLAAPFLMTNCQPAPTKARLKCQHRMTKGPRGSSETNCVQYELILYGRAGAGWLLAARSVGCASERMQGQAGDRAAERVWSRACTCLRAALCAQGLKWQEVPSGVFRWGSQRPSVGSQPGGQEVVTNLECRIENTGPLRPQCHGFCLRCAQHRQLKIPKLQSAPLTKELQPAPGVLCPKLQPWPRCPGQARAQQRSVPLLDTILTTLPQGLHSAPGEQGSGLPSFILASLTSLV